MMYAVKLNHWTSPATITAANRRQAAVIALRRFPTCDCCKTPTKVESIKEVR